VSGTTDVSIVSAALGLLGKGPISAFTEGTDLASTCGALYPVLKENILTMQPWRFAMKKVQLGQLTTAPVGEYTYAYQLPSDMIGGPHAAYNTNQASVPPFKDFKIFGNQLFCNETTVYLDYRFDCSESLWPAYFVRLMQLAFAADACFYITDQAELAKLYYAYAFGTPEMNGRGGQFLVATTMDAVQQGSQVEQDFPLTDIR
jgi:hypothetical protein